jgi:hypothetical protein
VYQLCNYTHRVSPCPASDSNRTRES